nr:aminoacyl-tRNA synthetase, class 1a, anticodon-binding [Tanacetum cinerariifolium]
MKIFSRNKVAQTNPLEGPPIAPQADEPMPDPTHAPNVEELIPSPVLEPVVQHAQQHHDQAIGGSLIYEHPPIPNPATPPVTKAVVNEPSSFATPSKTTAADSSQNEDISPSTMEAAQILTGGKLDPSKISKSPAAVAQRSVQTFVRKRSSKSTQGLDYSDVDFSPRDSVATDSSIPAEKVVPADKGVSAASSNKGKGTADELSPLPSIERQRDLDDMIANFRNTEWMILMARVTDFPKVAKEILGTDVNDDNFSSRLQDLVDKRKRAMSIQRYRAQQAKPMTRGETIQFMRTYIKNMSAAYYSSGRTIEWANKFKGDDLIAEYNKIKSDVERSTTSQGVKRSRPTLEPGSPKKMKSTAGPSLGSTLADEVPADTGVFTAASVPADQRVSADKSVPADTLIPADPCVSAEDATTTIPVNAPLDEDELGEESLSLRRSTRKKSIAQKRTTPLSSIPFSTDDPDAAHTVDITFASDDSDEDDSPHPIITGVYLLGWQVIPSGLGTIHTLFCHGGIRKTFTTLREILHMVDRQTLIRLYRFVDALSQKQPLDGIALSLWGDLKIMLDTLEVNFSSPVWQDQHKEYLLKIGVMEQLLDHKLQIEKDPVGQAGDNTDKQGSSSPSMVTSQVSCDIPGEYSGYQLVVISAH